MIEVEKKFLLDEEQEKKIITEAKFIFEKIFTDIYYDKSDYSLTKNDKWLRQRSGKWELKVSLDKTAGRKGDIYDEIEDENKIREILNIPVEDNFEDDLIRSGYSEFCSCKTTRKKYKLGGYGVDIDFVDFGDFNYSLAEIELMAEQEREVKYALQKIIELADYLGLENKYVMGKVLVYLERKKPEHFQVLVNSGVVKPGQF